MMRLETPPPTTCYLGLVRIGFACDVFWAGASSKLPRGTRVLVQTPRGIELGELLTAMDLGQPNEPPLEHDRARVEIVRAVTFQDEVLLERLARHKVDAVRKCQSLLRRAGSSAQLLDVDQLIDGGTLILHFLGDVTKEQQAWVDEVVEEYERSVESIRLSALIKQGCGPTCGQGDDSSGACGGACETCVGCSVRQQRTHQMGSTGDQA
ncbi:MAG: hypothetical protein AAGD07_03220 [Planctomycetota bacterium]